MEFIESKQWIDNFKRRWLIFSLLRLLMLSGAIALVVASLISHFSSLSFLLILPFLWLIVLVSLWIINPKGIKIKDLSSYLDQHFPVLEESSALVLQPSNSLSFLQKLQASKVNQLLPQLAQPKEPINKLKSGFLFLLVGLSISFLMTKLPLKSELMDAGSPTSAKAKLLADSIPPEIERLSVQISAPAYTKLESRNHNQFTLKVPIGSTVAWKITTNQSVKEINFIFNDSQVIGLKPLNKEKTEWVTQKNLKQTGFYQVEIDGKRSDLYEIAVVLDQPVAIKINKPLQQSVIDFGQPQQVNLQALLSDDYGISEAFIAATVTSGKGEGVSFKEQIIAFNQSVSGIQQAFNQFINLKYLGMKPGDELYFYVKAKDNSGQESRSDIYIVSIQDTSELMSLTGLASGVNLVPEYFRSQRQIIIDTEKLLKEKASITDTEFKNRSNNLGIDQKSLRLRYGKFLGEESETYGAEGKVEEHSADDGHNHSKEENVKFGDVQALMDEYAHKHDNAEDAGFFEPELKSRLKATLTEMWSAELRLRTYKPQEALPFEYKALRLLKDLQQSSRAYVAKTTVKTTPVKAEKRLTGELDKITNPVNKAIIITTDQKAANFKNAIVVLEQLKQKPLLSVNDKRMLNTAQIELITAASKNPSAYLPALKLMKKTMNGEGKINVSEIDRIENALQKLLGNVQPLPQAGSGVAASSLGKSYFQNLKNAKQ